MRIIIPSQCPSFSQMLKSQIPLSYSCSLFYRCILSLHPLLTHNEIDINQNVDIHQGGYPFLRQEAGFSLFKQGKQNASICCAAISFHTLLLFWDDFPENLQEQRESLIYLRLGQMRTQLLWRVLL